MIGVFEEDVVFVGHCCQGPWDQGWKHVVLYHVEGSHKGTPLEGSLYQHVYVVRDI